MNNKLKYCFISLLCILSDVAIADVNWSPNTDQTIFTSSSRILNSKKGSTAIYSSSIQRYSTIGAQSSGSIFGNNAVCSHSMPSMTTCSRSSTIMTPRASQPILATQSTYNPYTIKHIDDGTQTPDPYLDELPIGDIPIMLIVIFAAFYFIKKRLRCQTETKQ